VTIIAADREQLFRKKTIKHMDASLTQKGNRVFVIDGKHLIVKEPQHQVSTTGVIEEFDTEVSALKAYPKLRTEETFIDARRKL
jgi:hypothetical protein